MEPYRSSAITWIISIKWQFSTVTHEQVDTLGLKLIQASRFVSNAFLPVELCLALLWIRQRLHPSNICWKLKEDIRRTQFYQKLVDKIFSDWVHIDHTTLLEWTLFHYALHAESDLGSHRVVLVHTCSSVFMNVLITDRLYITFIINVTRMNGLDFAMSAPAVQVKRFEQFKKIFEGAWRKLRLTALQLSIYHHHKALGNAQFLRWAEVCYIPEWDLPVIYFSNYLIEGLRPCHDFHHVALLCNMLYMYVITFGVISFTYRV